MFFFILRKDRQGVVLNIQYAAGSQETGRARTFGIQGDANHGTKPRIFIKCRERIRDVASMIFPAELAAS